MRFDTKSFVSTESGLNSAFFCQKIWSNQKKALTLHPLSRRGLGGQSYGAVKEGPLFLEVLAH